MSPTFQLVEPLDLGAGVMVSDSSLSFSVPALVAGSRRDPWDLLDHVGAFRNGFWAAARPGSTLPSTAAARIAFALFMCPPGKPSRLSR